MVSTINELSDWEPLEQYEYMKDLCKTITDIRWSQNGLIQYPEETIEEPWEHEFYSKSWDQDIKAFRTILGLSNKITNDEVIQIFQDISERMKEYQKSKKLSKTIARIEYIMNLNCNTSNTDNDKQAYLEYFKKMEQYLNIYKEEHHLVIIPEVLQQYSSFTQKEPWFQKAIDELKLIAQAYNQKFSTGWVALHDGDVKWEIKKGVIASPIFSDAIKEFTESVKQILKNT